MANKDEKAKAAAKAKRERFRFDVLGVIKDTAAAFANGSGDRLIKQAGIIKALRKKGWTAHDFKDKWGSDDLERAVDAALQYHRRKGTIRYDRSGWELVPVADEGVQG